MLAPCFVLRLAALCGLAAALPTLSAFYTPAQWPLDVTAHAVGRDFVNVWGGGRLLWEGAWPTLFDPHAYNQGLQRVFDARINPHVWSYPPTSFLLAAPLALLPYGTALATWTLAGLVALVAAARLALDQPRARKTTLLVLLAPATALNVLCGQNGFFTAALMAGGVLLIDRRPLLAGVFIGLLTYKPQFGLVLAPALLALGAWRTIAAATATAAALALVSIAAFGLEPWSAFVHQTLPMQGRMLANYSGFFTTMLISPYAGLRGAGLSHSMALSMQAGVSLLAIAACLTAVRRTTDADTRLAIIATATALATPYAMSYDLPILALVVARRVARAVHTTATDAAWPPATAMLYAGAWALPLAAMPLSIVGLPITPFLMAAILIDHSLSLTRTEHPATAGQAMSRL